ncbi:MAG: ABC transporter substrate-binding protein [Dehalococcoidia bacterium]
MRLREGSPWLCLLLIMAATAIFAGCSSGSEERVSSELYIYNWEDYLAPETLASFEKEFGIRVTLDTYEDEEIMFSVIQSDPSKYDVVFPSDSLLASMVDSRLLAELDHSQIPNLANIAPQFLDPPWDRGNKYSVPYDWGTTGIIYNSRFVDEPVHSWSLLWDARLAGRIAMLNSYYSNTGLTLKYLGYSLNSTDAAELAEAEAKLIEQRPLIRGYLDPIEIRELMVSEELWAAQSYNGDALMAMERNENLRFVVPEEGSDIYVDVMAIPRDARHKDAAHLFLNYILRPDVHAANTNYTGYASPNRAAIEQGLIDPQVLSDPVVYPDRSVLEWWRDLGEGENLWNRVWANVQASAAGMAPPVQESE